MEENLKQLLEAEKRVNANVKAALERKYSHISDTLGTTF